MKKLFAKLALFTFVSIMLSLPVQATNESGLPDCIDDQEKKDFIITILEEPLGKADETKPDYKTRDCCRVTFTTTGPEKAIKSELTDGPCDDLCTPVEPEEGQEAPTISAKCEEVMIILSKGGVSMIEGYIAQIYKWAASIVGLIAVTVIIISGIQIAMSGGDTQAVESGKTRIIKSLSGLAVLFLSGLILYTINPNFFTFQ
ncbi:MAG: pilin [Candidatus Gracilibacteria bacterium]|jgi:hypothetical protein